MCPLGHERVNSAARPTERMQMSPRDDALCEAEPSTQHTILSGGIHAAAGPRRRRQEQRRARLDRDDHHSRSRPERCRGHHRRVRGVSYRSA
ncbi:hypothetical protein CH260_11835, partial [Rhodococcus sp. 05-2256-B2]